MGSSFAAVPALTDLITGPRLLLSLAGIMVVALAASRLLGARRSLMAILVSGLLGWLVGATLAVVLARNHEHGSAGFIRDLWLFSAFFTMSATVWIEMLAKPGGLVRTQSYLASVPRPLRGVRRRSARVSRYLQISRIAACNGLGRSIRVDDEHGAEETSASRAPVEVRLRRALEEAGGMFVKLGQVMSTRSDLLPDTMVAELSHLQNDVKAASRQDIEPILEAELGAAVDEVFAELDWRPLAAASIGQVYRARLRSNETVIVKVERPGIAEAVERDLDVLQQLAQAFQARMTWAREYGVDELVDEFATRLREELDFGVEARNAIEIRSITAEVSGISIPVFIPSCRADSYSSSSFSRVRAQVSLFSAEDDVRTLTRLLNRSILAFFGIGVGVISVILMGITGGPEFTGKTSLYEFFGYFGLFCSSILIMRVLIAIFHDRLN